MMTTPNNQIAQTKYLQTATMVLVVCLLLYFGRSLFIPLSFSLLIACVLYPICAWFEKKGMNRTVAITLSMLLLVILGGGVVTLMFFQIGSFFSDWPALQLKLQESMSAISDYLNHRLGISIEQQTEWLKNMRNDSGTKFLPALQTTLGSISVFVVMLVLIPILAALILYQRASLFEALKLMIKNYSAGELKTILHETITTYYNFIKGMLLVYVIVGVLNSVGLLILGIPHAILFGFIAAVLTFIPYIGIMIGALLPMAVSWMTFNSIYYPLGVVLIFTIVQYLEANIIFPWAVSNKLNVNTLSTIMATSPPMSSCSQGSSFPNFAFSGNSTCWNLGGFRFFFGGPNLVGGIASLAEKKGDTMYSYLRAGDGVPGTREKIHICICFVNCILVVLRALKFLPSWLWHFPDHRSEDASSLRVEGCNPPLLQGPTHHRLRWTPP
jgi:predicted PurR-regulated permease PerM